MQSSYKTRIDGVLLALALGLSFLLPTHHLRAQTTSGTLAADETWSGTVVLEGDVIIPGAVTLTISPGTEVRFKPLQDTNNSGDPERIEIVVDGGHLNAAGTAAAPIVFTSDASPAEPGDYYGIVVNEGDVTLKHFQMFAGRIGLNFNDTDTRFSEYQISDGVIQNFLSTGIWTQGRGDEVVPVVITRVDVLDTNQDPSTTSTFDGKGVYAEGPIELVDCEILRSAIDGVYGDAATVVINGCLLRENVRNGVWISRGHLTLMESTIELNGDRGIVAAVAGVVVDSSFIRENRASGLEADLFTENDLRVSNSVFESNGMNGIWLKRGTSTTDVSLTGNRIANNGRYGIAVDLTGFGVTVEITGNEIVANGADGIWYGDGINQVLTVTGNHIADNGQMEIRNNNDWPIVANGNSWGEATLNELRASRLNLTKILDQRDDPSVGQVLIDDWFPESVLSADPGALERFDYSRPDVDMIVSGGITGQETWSGTVLVTGDVFVQAGATLIVNPGTTVMFELLRDTEVSGWWPSRSELVLNGGVMIAEGTPDQPILFTTSSGNVRPEESWIGDWMGIRIDDGDMTLKHFEISYGIYGLVFNDSNNRFNAYEISDGLIRNTLRVGVWTNGEGDEVKSVLVRNLTINETDDDDVFPVGWDGHGVYAEGPIELVNCQISNSAADGVYADDATVVLSGCLLRENVGHGVRISGRNLTLLESTIELNGDRGILASSAEVVVDSSFIRENSASGLEAGLGTENDLRVSNSVFEANGMNGIWFKSGRSTRDVSLTGNRIANNGTDGIAVDLNLNFPVTTLEITGNEIVANGSDGIWYADGIDQVLTVTGNHIADNGQMEIRNDNNWTIVANGNSWGEATRNELRSSKLNLTKIFDSRDDVTKGQVLITDWLPESVLSTNPGAVENYDFSRPDITKIVSGAIDSQETWSGRVLVTGDVTVNPGAALFILPGTTVLFEPLMDVTVSGWWFSRCELIVNGGALIAEGTPEQPISFISGSPEIRPQEDWPGDWLGIRLNDGDMSLKHFEIAHAIYGIVFNDTDNRLNVTDVQDGVIRNCRRVGIWTNGEGENVRTITVANVEIRDIEEDPNFTIFQEGDGVFAEGPIELLSCRILNSKDNGIQGDDARIQVENCEIVSSINTGVRLSGGSLLINDSLVANSENHGIVTSSASVSMNRCSIINNLDWGMGIEDLASTEGATLIDNVFDQNGNGGLVITGGGADTRLNLQGNTFSNNETIGFSLSVGSNVPLSESEFIGNVYFGNNIGFRNGSSGSGAFEIFDSDLYDNREWDFRNESSSPVNAVNVYLGEASNAQLAQGEANLTLIYDELDASARGLFSIADPRDQAILKVPEFLTQPQNATATLGGAADFYASAAGTPLITYQWYQDGVALNRETNKFLQVRLITSAKTGAYTVVATNPVGETTSQPAQLILNVPGTPPSITQHPQNITLQSGQSLTLQVQATGTQPLAYQWRKDGQAIPGAVSDVYTVTSVSVADGGTYNVVVANSEGSVTSNPAIVTVEGGTNGGGGAHPADANEDFTISISEVTAYGAAWKRGDVWPVDPNPIPIGYLTRAGALWKNGETYQVDSSIPEPPLWWVNTSQVGLSAITLHNTGAPGSVTRSFNELTVTLDAQPSADVLAYAVEETLPQGFEAIDISLSGSFDPNGGKVKWGPFFDNQARTLSYTLVVPNGFVGVATLEGVGSFDGADVATGGDSALTIDDSNPPVNGGAPAVREVMVDNGGLLVRLDVSPDAGTGVYAIEEIVPEGFMASAINENGAFDANSGKIKWGPFFDNQVRNLSYTLTPPAGFQGVVQFSGASSFDGTDLSIGGLAEIDVPSSSNGTGEAPELTLEIFSGVWITGTVGAEYIIDYSDTLNPGSWIELDMITLETSPQLWIDIDSPEFPSRFYRARLP